RGESANGLALAPTAAMGNTDVTSIVQLNSSTGSGVVARAANGNYYAAVLDESLSSVDIVRVSGGATTLLVSGSVTIADSTSYTLELRAMNASPVSLQALLNGSVIASVSD